MVLDRASHGNVWYLERRSKATVIKFRHIPCHCSAGLLCWCGAAAGLTVSPWIFSVNFFESWARSICNCIEKETFLHRSFTASDLDVVKSRQGLHFVFMSSNLFSGLPVPYSISKVIPFLPCCHQLQIQIYHQIQRQQTIKDSINFIRSHWWFLLGGFSVILQPSPYLL